MTQAKLIDEPEGVDATIVECPSCGAGVGWACGEAHCMGAHAARIRAAQRWLKQSGGLPPEVAP